MIVDDDQMIVRGLDNIIDRMELDKVTVLKAYNAFDALDMLKYEGADLLITDVEMPVMNGLELVGEAKKRSYCDRFIRLSGFDSFEFAREALRLKAADDLLKPIGKTELQNLVCKFYKEIHKTPMEKEEVDFLPGYDIYAREPDHVSLPERFAAILQYMGAHYMNNLSLEKLSAQFNVHPNYLCSLFKSKMNTTFLHYLDNLRLRSSVALLLNEMEMPVAEIAEASGFMNDRQFYNVFKKRIGITPGAFRKLHAGVRIKAV
jgi:YesN/AraC family two-component response regulator